MEIKTIKWQEIHKKDWVHTLQSVPMNSYIGDLPFEVLPQSCGFTLQKEYELDDETGKLITGWMEFIKIRHNGMTVWQRTK